VYRLVSEESGVPGGTRLIVGVLTGGQKPTVEELKNGRIEVRHVPILVTFNRGVAAEADRVLVVSGWSWIRNELTQSGLGPSVPYLKRRNTESRAKESARYGGSPGSGLFLRRSYDRPTSTATCAV